MKIDTAEKTSSFDADLANDVIEGLSQKRRTLPCKYLYDETGANLFEKITTLPEYYLTRTEIQILTNHANHFANLIDRQTTLVEFGAGNIAKTKIFLDHIPNITSFVPIDISPTQLLFSIRPLQKKYPEIEIRPLQTDYMQPFELPLSHPFSQKKLFFFPGSTIGNLKPWEAVRFLRQLRSQCHEGDLLMIGFDLKKDIVVLENAYNDSEGITAAFNLNILNHINRRLGSEIPTQHFRHYAFFNPIKERIEMHLVIQKSEKTTVCGETFDFEKGESIRTEYSYKYTFERIQLLSKSAGFKLSRDWTDRRNWFCVACLEPDV